MTDALQENHEASLYSSRGHQTLIYLTLYDELDQEVKQSAPLWFPIISEGGQGHRKHAVTRTADILSIPVISQNVRQRDADVKPLLAFR